MPKFRKPITRAGLYRVSTLDGGRRWEAISTSRLRHWADEAARYLEAGNKIPGPWSHFEDGKPVIMTRDGSLPRSDINAGFWDRLWVENDTLWGEVDVPGDANDPATPAGKVGTTVRETSIFTVPEFQDGKGNTFKDIPLHVALVTHPIEPGQGNFEKLAEGELSIAMSHCVLSLPVSMSMPGDPTGAGTKPSYTEQGPGGKVKGNSGDGIQAGDPFDGISNPGIQQLLQALMESGIKLPSDTTLENLMERLLIALGQKALTEEQNPPQQQQPVQPAKPDSKKGSTYNPPDGAQERPATIAMSNTPAPAQIDEATLMAHPVVQRLVAGNQALVAHVNSQEANARKARIDALVKRGVITKDYADKNLAPLLEGFAMSFGTDGKPVPHAIDLTLNALESAAPAAALMSKLPGHQPAKLPAAFASLFLPEKEEDLASLMSFNGQLPAGATEIPNSDEPNMDAAIDLFMDNTGLRKKQPA